MLDLQSYLRGKGRNVPLKKGRLDLTSYMLGKSASGGIQEITGTLPLTVRSRTSQILKNYRIYGTASEAGVETENLFEVYTNGGGYREFIMGGLTAVIDRYDQSIILNGTSTVQYPQAPIKGSQGVLRLVPNKTYTVALTFENVPENALVYLIIQGTTNNSNWVTMATTRKDPLVTFSFTEAYIDYRYLFVCEGLDLIYTNTKVRISIAEGEVSSFIPYGYKLPLKVTADGTTTDYPVYIGDSQLMAEEYVDYESGKVYKRTGNLWKSNSIKTEISGVTIESGSSDIHISSNNSSAAISANSDVWKTNILSSDLIGDYSFAYWIEGQHGNMAMGFYKIDDTRIFTSNKNNNSFSFEADGSKYYAGFYFPKGWVGDIIIKIMLTEGSTPPESYIPYLQPKDLPVPLPDISLPQGTVTIDIDGDIKPQATIKGKIKQI